MRTTMRNKPKGEQHVNSSAGTFAALPSGLFVGHPPLGRGMCKNQELLELLEAECDTHTHTNTHTPTHPPTHARTHAHTHPPSHARTHA